MSDIKLTEPWKNRLASFDFEVTAYDWLLVIKDKQTKEYFIFHNDNIGVADFLDSHNYIYAAYNNKHYDNYILKGILNNYSPAEIKKINDWIIKEGQNGWEYPFDDKYVSIPPTTDLMLDMPKAQSLKELEGNMLMDIRESTVDFNIDHPWTKEEFEEMVFYCKHDVDSVERLTDERMGYLEAKVFNGTRSGLTIEQSLYKTNGQLAAIALGAEKQEFNDERDIQFPKTVNWNNIPKEVIDFFNMVSDESIPAGVLFKKKLKIQLMGLEWTFAWGGVHASVECRVVTKKEGYVFLIWDVTSLYPTLMEVYGLLSRAIPDPKRFSDMKYERVKAKHNGDKVTAKNLKVPINTVYGISLQEFNDCYDPRNGRSVCVTGQLLLTDLSVELHKQCKSLEMINVNTDGIAFVISEAELEKAYAIKEEWEKRTGCELEEGRIKRMILKDVNNYIMENEDGSLEIKGGYVANYPKGTFDSNSLSITHKAIVEYFLYGTPVEETINACNDPFQFQLIAKTGRTYDKTVHYVDGEEIDVQRVNRVYAVKDTRYGVIKKVKKQYLEVEGDKRYYINQKDAKSYKKNWQTDDGGDFFIRKDTTQNCPKHAIIDNGCEITSNTIDTIDKEWYIEFAKKRINDFLGIKEEKKKMARKKETLELETPESNPAMLEAEEPIVVVDDKIAQIKLYRKIMKLSNWLSEQKYTYDGYNKNQDFEYVKSYNYRELLGKGCRKVGLVFKENICNRQFQKLEATKNMNLTTIYGSVSLIDPETAAHEDYTVMGDGADNLDKGIYKAETMLMKYFVLNNFLLPQQQEEIDPEESKKVEPVKISESTEVSKPDVKLNTPKPKVDREEAKEEVINDKYATKEFLNQILSAIEKVREAKPGYGKTTETKINEGIEYLDGKEDAKPITKIEAVGLMNKVEERMDKLGIK